MVNMNNLTVKQSFSFSLQLADFILYFTYRNQTSTYFTFTCVNSHFRIPYLKSILLYMYICISYKLNQLNGFYAGCPFKIKYWVITKIITPNDYWGFIRLYWLIKKNKNYKRLSIIILNTLSLCVFVFVSLHCDWLQFISLRPIQQWNQTLLFW